MKTDLIARLIVAVAACIRPVSCWPFEAAARAEAAVNYNLLAPHYVPLRRAPEPAQARAPLPRFSSSGGPDGSVQPPQHGAALRNMHDIYYIVDLEIGNQTIPVNVDTGSSDTWIVQSPFSCVRENPFGFNYVDVPMDRCGFGKGFAGNLSGGNLPGSRFDILYGDGTFASGYFGLSDVSIGGLTAKLQQLAVVNYTYWHSDGKASGLLGLAYPLMTSPEDSALEYDPIFTSFWKQNLTRPMFSITLSRDDGTGDGDLAGSASPASPGSPGSPGATTTATTATGAKKNGSFLGFGGVPPVDYDASSWGQAPIQPLRTLDSWSFLKSKDRGLYVIQPDAVVAGGRNLTTKATDWNVTKINFPVVVDAGSTLNIVKTIFNMFDPPAAWLGSGGASYAPCNATVPQVGVRFGTQTYFFSPKDLLNQNIRDVETGKLCRVGLYDAEVGPYILGMTFLNNVVAVFDIGNNEMRFASRNPY